jgi:multiple sugar transport system ATP-binding protein
MMGIQIRGLTKRYAGNVRALDGLDLEVHDGELLVLAGPSGSGKTTLLRLIAGLETPTAGTIRIHGQDVAQVPVHQRRVGMVFQNLALYSHLTVAENLAFGLEKGREASARRRPAQGAVAASDARLSGSTSSAVAEIVSTAPDRVAEVAHWLELEGLLDRYPGELSGGQQQRVALGRALAGRPAALLLDEPLSSLDLPTRRGLRRDLKRLQRELGIPTIYVTHDQAEAMVLGDRIAVLADGRLHQVGTPRDIYQRPATLFAASFFGPEGMNILRGALARTGGRAIFRVGEWSLDVTDNAPQSVAGPVLCGVRPEAVRPGVGNLVGVVNAVESFVSDIYVQVEIPGTQPDFQFIVAQQVNREMHAPRRGSRLAVEIQVSELHWFDAKNGTRLP